MRIKNLYVVLFVGVFLSACRSIAPAVPSLPPNAEEVPSLPVSQIEIPVQVDLKTLYNQIEKNVPEKLTSLGYPAFEKTDNCALSFKWNFWRDKLSFSAKDNTLSINCLGYYQGEGEARTCCWDVCPAIVAGCGYTEPARQLQIGITSSIVIKNNYKISPQTTVTKLNAINKCKVTALNFDITNRIINTAKPEIEKACKDFDASIAKMDFRPQVESVWKSLYSPIAIDTFGYLVFAPTAIKLSAITTQNNLLKFSVGLSALPHFLLDSSKLPIAPKLPDIAPSTKPANGFSVHLDTRLHYPRLSQLVNAQMKGMRFEYGKKHIEVLDVQLSGTGNKKLMIKVNFKGSAKGWVYLTGTPKFDSTTQELILPDLELDIETQNVLLKSAKWLFNNKLTNSMRENARYSLKEMFTTIKRQIEANLNKNLGNGITTGGQVSKLGISQITPYTDFIQLTALIEGNLIARINDIK